MAARRLRRLAGRPQAVPRGARRPRIRAALRPRSRPRGGRTPRFTAKTGTGTRTVTGPMTGTGAMTGTATEAGTATAGAGTATAGAGRPAGRHRCRRQARPQAAGNTGNGRRRRCWASRAPGPGFPYLNLPLTRECDTLNQRAGHATSCPARIFPSRPRGNVSRSPRQRQPASRQRQPVAAATSAHRRARRLATFAGRRARRLGGGRRLSRPMAWAGAGSPGGWPAEQARCRWVGRPAPSLRIRQPSAAGLTP